jgi:hypothetical protein
MTGQTALLALIVGAYLGLGTLYAVQTPRWQAPDEPAHYNYIKEIALTGQLPVLQPGDWDGPYLDTLKARRFPPDLPVDSLRYESHQPPLYYLLAAPLFRLTASWPLDRQVVALRLLSVVIGAGVLLLAHQLVRENFPQDRELALLVPAFMATVPMHIAIGASISNDLLAEGVLLALLWYALRQWRRPTTLPRTFLRLGALLGLALLTKATLYLPALAVSLLTVWVIGRRQKAPGRVVGQGLLLVLLAALVVAGWWFVRNIAVYGPADPLGLQRHDQVVADQPRTGPLTAAKARTMLLTAFKSFWAQFGWMGVLIDERFYWALAALSAVAGGGLLLWLWRLAWGEARLGSSERGALGLLGLTLALVAGGAVAYNLVYLQPQGRYLFPALVAIAVGFCLGLREVLNPRHVPVLFAGLFLGLGALDLLALYRYLVPALRV